jgi:hypothetical protein
VRLLAQRRREARDLRLRLADRFFDHGVDAIGAVLDRADRGVDRVFALIEHRVDRLHHLYARLGHFRSGAHDLFVRDSPELRGDARRRLGFFRHFVLRSSC